MTIVTAGAAIADGPMHIGLTGGSASDSPTYLTPFDRAGTAVVGVGDDDRPAASGA